MQGRRHDLDALRIGAIAIILPYHAAKFFDHFGHPDSFYVMNDAWSAGLTMWVVGAINTLPLPLLFLLSGCAARFALARRTDRQYLDERLRRLAVPYLFAQLTVVPLMGWIGQLRRPDPAASPLAYYPRFFHLDPGDPQGYFGSLNPGHLWFILYLFVFSLVLLPLFRHFQTPAGEQRLRRWADRFTRSWWLWTWAAALVVAFPIPGLAGKSPLYYALFYVAGYLLFTDPRYQEAVDRLAPVSLALGLAGVVLTCVTNLNPAVYPQLPGWFRFGIAVQFRTVATWLSMIGFLGVGHRLIRSTHPVLGYLSDIAYPFYILHLPVMVVLGYFVVRAPLWPVAEFALLVVLTGAITVAACEYAIKPTDLGRFLFGMKAKAASTRPAPAEHPT